jgi:hypothetical protein
VFPLLRQIVGREEDNLFRFIHASLLDVCAFLGIGTPLVVSSTLGIDHGLEGQEKVLAICRHLGATTYINAMGGGELYSSEAFAAQDIALRFLRPRPCEYPQFGNAFVPWLSILDAMMFNSVEQARPMLDDYWLVARDKMPVP